jgi:hypothetical protein
LFFSTKKLLISIYYHAKKPIKHIVAGLQCVSDNKSSLGSMLLLEYNSNNNSNPTNIQITNINTIHDKIDHIEDLFHLRPLYLKVLSQIIYILVIAKTNTFSKSLIFN